MPTLEEKKNILSPDQVTEYYKTQSSASNPLSPTEYATRNPIIVSPQKAEGAIDKANETKANLTPEIEETKTEAKVEEKPQEKTGGGYSFDEAIELFGQDFTGLQKLDDGTFEADSSALSRLGIKTDTDEIDKQTKDIENAKTVVSDLTTKLQNLDISKDPSFMALSNGITNTWNERITEMENANKSRQASLSKTGIRLGSRFVSLGSSFEGVISTEETQGIQRVASLEAQKQQALANAEIAFRSQKWDEYVDLIALAEESYSKEVEELNALNQVAIDRNEAFNDEIKAQREAEEFEMERVDNVLENITDSVFNAMTGDAEVDMQTIQDMAVQYDIDPNYLISKLTAKQGEEEERLTDLEAVQALTQQREASAEKSLRVSDTSTKVNELDKAMSPNELRITRDDYGLTVDELPPGSTLRDAQVKQAEKFAEANKEEDPEEVKKAIVENTNLEEKEAQNIVTRFAVKVYKALGGKGKKKEEPENKESELDDLLNSL